MQLRASYLQAPEYISEAPVALSASMITDYLICLEDISDEDAKVADQTFCAFGYVAPVVVTPNPETPSYSILNQIFFGRTQFNYMQFSFVMLQTEFGADVTADAQKRLLAGVRLWHRKPMLGKMWSENPKRDLSIQPEILPLRLEKGNVK